jgi:hypothetical protein
MCSIGWIKLNDSWILFKNRDRAVGEPKENFIIQDDTLIGFGDRKFPGLWIGINKFGVGVTSAYGPLKDICGLEPENFEANEAVLRESSTTDEAVRTYSELAKKLGRSYNILITDSSRAIALEIIPNDLSKTTYKKIAAKTNYFTELTKYNIDQERTERSVARRKKIMEFLPKARGSEEVMSILKFHSKTDDLENICRHDKNETVGSAIFEINNKSLHLRYLLNKSPHSGEYEDKTLNSFLIK